MTTTYGLRSDALRKRAIERTPGGIHSNVRAAAPPVFFARGSGARLWDVDGRDYIDYLIGQGPNILGHAPDVVNRQVAEATANGIALGGQSELEVYAAELFIEVLGWPDMVRFGVTGTEMVQVALRLARAVTGRERFVRFEGHYHGWLDNVLTGTGGDGAPTLASKGQLASQFHEGDILPWNDADALAAHLRDHSGSIAAVIMEPFMCNNGAVAPRNGYLEEVRRLCDEHGVVLIFDEVITGFRLALGGAAQRFGVTPDLATYGKAMAGGWPVAALAGRRDLMERFASGVNHSGTFNGSMMATSAVVATLEHLRTTRPHERMEAHGYQLQEGISELADRFDLPLRVQGFGVAFHVSFGDPERVYAFRDLARFDTERYAHFAWSLARHGIWVAGRGIWYVSAAHGDQELAEVLERLEKALTSEAF